MRRTSWGESSGELAAASIWFWAAVRVCEGDRDMDGAAGPGEGGGWFAAPVGGASEGVSRGADEDV